MNSNKWNPYVLKKGTTETVSFFKTHFSKDGKKTLFILGKGFDVRMNITLEKLIKSCPTLELDCWLVEFDEGSDSYSQTYMPLVDQNITDVNVILNGRSVINKQISIWSGNGKSKRRVGDRNAAAIVQEFSQISQYTDIIIDISSLPRGVYTSLVGKVLALIEANEAGKTINLFVSVAENAVIDREIKEYGMDDDLSYLQGFGGGIELESEIEKPIIWFPVLGEGKAPHFSKALNHIMGKSRPYEVCPVLPFPAKNPRRVDALLIEYHTLLFDTLNIEAKNILYVPEQNPFEAYIRLHNVIKNYYDSLQPLNGCKAIISTFSSKLLSIGALLTAHEFRNSIGVGLLNVDSEGYRIDSQEYVKNLLNQSEVFLSWLTGEPYQNQKSE